MTKEQKPQDANEGTIGAVALTAGLGAWLPIETAPKDGSFVLLYFPPGFGRSTLSQNIFIGHWHTPNNKNYPGTWSCGSNRNLKTATHWMPLPETPNAKSQAAGAALSRQVAPGTEG